MDCSEKYILNSELQEMQLGEGEGTVFYNPQSENTHVLDDVAQDVVKMFINPSTIEDAVAGLATMYEEDVAVIDRDVREFIAKAIQDNIILQVEE